MPTARPFAYNTGSTIDGTDQIGNIAVGRDPQDYSLNPGGVKWWNGPDEDSAYVIAYPQSNDLHPTPEGSYNRLTLNPSYRGTDVVLSNNNQTAHQQFGYQQSVLGNTEIVAFDKIMFSVLVNLSDPGSLPGSHFIGLGTTSMNYQGNPYGGFPGNDSNSFGYSSDGNLYWNNQVAFPNLQTWGDGDIIDLCLSGDQYSFGLWVRVNGGNWNNNPASIAGTNLGMATPINSPFYPVLCPGYAGTMTIQNKPAYEIPANFKFLGNTTASLGFWGDKTKTDAGFLALVENKLGQTFGSAFDAKAWLSNQGYWSNYSAFGSSGFQWMNISSITSTTASGSGQNGITVSITKTGGGLGNHSGMYSAATFPEQYGVPLAGSTQILNSTSGVFTATFSQPVTNPLIAFASVGNPSLSVPVQSTAPFTPIWGTSTTYQNAVNGTQYTQFTGNEGFNIIRVDGTLSSVSFNYTVSEYYSTICFGFVNQNV
jgi:hypothetical protein